MVVRPGFHFATVLAHRSSGCDAILTAKRHFILLYISIQHGIWAAFVAVLLFTMLNKRCLCVRKYDLDVSSCLYLLNDAHGLIRFLIFAVSCC